MGVTESWLIISHLCEGPHSRSPATSPRLISRQRRSRERSGPRVPNGVPNGVPNCGIPRTLSRIERNSERLSELS
jgi:hypothetical protein